MEFEWKILPGFTTLQLCNKVQEFMSKMNLKVMSMFNDISWRTTDDEQECIANATLVSLFAKRFQAGRWSFLGRGSEKKWYSAYNERPQGKWDRVAESDTQFSEPRVHCPKERSKANEVENYRYTSVPMGIRLKLFFAQLFLLISSVSTEQSQIYVRNTVPVKQELGDPCWQDKLTHRPSQQNY